MKDKHNRSISYLRISVTDRCNLRCRYCMPEEGISKKEHNDMLSLEEIFEVVRACTALGITKVRITGGEPLVRKGLITLIEGIAKLEQIKDIALTTNGILLSKYAKQLKEAGLKRVNISLDSLNNEKFKDITRCGTLRDVLEGIEGAKKAGLTPLKLNTVLIGGFNDDEIEDFVRLTIDEPIDVRFIELMPIGQAAGWAKNRFVPNTLVLDKCKELTAIANDDAGSPAAYYRLPNAKGRVGLINPISHVFCGDCNRIRLTADGKLKPCLHSNQEIDIKSIIRQDEGSIEEGIKEAVYSKPLQHGLNDADNKPIERDMFKIGG